MRYFVFVSFIALYTVIEIVYFRIARKFKVVDAPNVRSSHSIVTIRGGGIIFPIALLVPLLTLDLPGTVFLATGLVTIASISFLDDVHNLSSSIRLLFQVIAVVLLIQGIAPDWPPAVYFIALLLIVGILNGFNFMDGINGITALYSIVTVGTLFWINQNQAFTLPGIIYVSVLASLVAFSFFNVRNLAKCFAGDVGSISIVYIICFMLVSLVLKAQFYCWFFLLAIYGIDVGFTFICRAIRGESLTKAHRSHFYQYLTNEFGLKHITVSSLYASAQLLLNIVVISSFHNSTPGICIIVLFGFLVIYAIFRLRLEGWNRLFVKY